VVPEIANGDEPEGRGVRALRPSCFRAWQIRAAGDAVWSVEPLRGDLFTRRLAAAQCLRRGVYRNDDMSQKESPGSS
jgi:hypothetical protein